MLLFTYTFWAFLKFFHQEKKSIFISFIFCWSITFLRKNIDQSETKLSVELYVKRIVVCNYPRHLCVTRNKSDASVQHYWNKNNVKVFKLVYWTNKKISLVQTGLQFHVTLVLCLTSGHTSIFCNTYIHFLGITAQKMFSIKDFFSKCDQIGRKLQIWSHLLKKSLMEKFIFCAVNFAHVSSF